MFKIKLEFVLLELLIGSMILGGILAHKRSIGERLCLLASVPVSFLLAFVVTKLGAFDFLGKLSTDFLLRFSVVRNYIGISMAATSSVSSIVAVLVRPGFLIVVFWLLLLVFKLIVSAIAEKCNTGIFEKSNKLKDRKNIIAILIAVVGAYVIIMLSCFPLEVLSHTFEPAVQKATAEKYKGTYINELVTVIDEKYMPTSDTELFGKIQKYTGFKWVLDKTSDSLGNTSLVTNGGKKIDFNVVKLMQELFLDEVDLLAFYDHITSPESRSGAELSHISNVLDTFSDEPLVLAVLPEILDAIQTSSPMLADFLEITHKNYSAEDISVLADDIRHLSNAVQEVADGAVNEKLRKGNVLPVIIHSLSDKRVAEKVSRELSEMTIYADSVNLLLHYGVEYLCDSEMPDAKEEMLSAIVTLDSHNESDILAFSQMISAVARLVCDVRESENGAVDAVLGDFSEIGEVLDGLNSYKASAQLPELLLEAITDNELYGKYFADNTVSELMENLKAGKTTYTELFSAVEAIYNIANKVVASQLAKE